MIALTSIFRPQLSSSTSKGSSSTASSTNKNLKPKTRSTQEQIADLSPDELACYNALKNQWQTECPEAPLTEAIILRMARYNKFNQKTSIKTLKNMDDRYLTLTGSQMKKQLRTQTLFPLAGVKTLADGSDVFYMRPSRYFPKQTPTQDIVDNLVYVMNCLNERPHNAKHGIGFIANMQDWKMTNFSADYCMQFMQTLQGNVGVPCVVSQFLIVNPPSWFGSTWKMIKPMLAPSFARKVHFVRNEDKLAKFLAPGYKQFLPTEMKSGRVPTDEIVQDFIDVRRHKESKRKHQQGTPQMVIVSGMDQVRVAAN